MDMKILIVDDEPKLRQTLAEVFVANGYDVFMASDGKEALKIYSGKDINFVLMDIGMPKMDGITAYREMIKINSALKEKANPHIVLMTGDVVKLEEAMKEGIKVSGKPFDTEKVIALFSELMWEETKKSAIFSQSSSVKSNVKT